MSKIDTTKRRLSFFLFGLTSTTSSKQSVNQLSASPTNKSDPESLLNDGPSPNTHIFVNPSAVLKGSEADPAPSSPVSSENPDSNIFERCVQEFPFEPVASRSNSIKVRTHNSSVSLKGPLIRNEDLIPPALDATTSILNDKDTNLDDVEMIYSSRRNSSVIGLNMALGRPFTPSRKNSTYSIHQLLPMERSTSSLSSTQHPKSPVSPPKLHSSKSSVNFYSYADMLSNDEFSRRPSFKLSYSQGLIPTMGRKFSTSSGVGPSCNCKTSTSKLKGSLSQLSRQLSARKKVANTPPPSQSQLVSGPSGLAATELPKRLSLSKSTTSNLNSFLISPESSDGEDLEVFYPALTGLNKRKSLSSTNSQLNSIHDSESLVSSSVADCIRQSTTEINGH